MPPVADIISCAYFGKETPEYQTLVKYLIHVHHGYLLQSLNRNFLNSNEQVLWNEILLIYKIQWKLSSNWLRMASKTDLCDT